MNKNAKTIDFSTSRTDWHIHSNYSDGLDDMELLVRTAEFQNMKAIAVTDHLEGDNFMNGKNIGEYLEAIDKAASSHPKIKVYKGIEGTILDIKGSLSVSRRNLTAFYPVLIDFGWKLKGISIDTPHEKVRILKNISEAFKNLCKNETVDIVAHPFNFGRLIKGFEFSWLSDAFLEEIAGYFVEGGKYFEIMNNIWWWFPEMPVARFNTQYFRVINIFNSLGVKFSMGSDAHYHQGVGNLRFAEMLLKKVKSKQWNAKYK